MLSHDLAASVERHPIVGEDDWRALPAQQQPDWPDPMQAARVLADLEQAPGLVTPAECDALTNRLAAVARGEAFVLQGGYCAELLNADSEPSVCDILRLLLQMALVLTYASGLPVVKIGRIAGQYAKPRSEATETRNGQTLPTYRGDAVNSVEFTLAARTPDPRRLRWMYNASARTLDTIRHFVASGGVNLRQLYDWNREFVDRSPFRQYYEPLAAQIDRALQLMQAYGVVPNEPHNAELFVSHEGLLLDYEAALTRYDQRCGLRYANSGQMLWIGERTRDLDGAHVAYVASINNPIGVKLGPDTTSDTALALIDRLDPHRRPGRLTFITRMGARQIRNRLPDLVEKVTASGAQVIWVCDPMHGNTFEAPSGHKTRRFDDILDEVAGFLQVHKALGTHPGGIHLELTAGEVTECVGGAANIEFDDLRSSYTSACDPRLNRSQSLDLAFLVAEMLTSRPF